MELNGWGGKIELGREIHHIITFLNTGTSRTHNVIRVIIMISYHSLEVTSSDSDIGDEQ